MDEADVQLDEGRAARLIAARFPQLAGEPVRALTAKGTDNHIFRIGNDLCARFPKVAWAADTARREVAALPRFAGAPLPVPAVFGLGEAVAPESVTVRWADGTETALAGFEYSATCDLRDSRDRVDAARSTPRLARAG